MDCVKMNHLNTVDFNLSNLFAMNQCWENNHVFEMRVHTGRPTSAFLYIEDCTAEYVFENRKSMTAKKGEFVYLPQGANYKTVFCDTVRGKTSTMLVEFVTSKADGTPFVFYPRIMKFSDINGCYKIFFTEFIKLYLSPVQPLAMMKSNLYKFLSELSSSRRLNSIYSKEFSQIAQGIIYLENNALYDKNIAEIAAMCHVSTSCFRRLFKKYSGLSPMQYQIAVKMEHAKKLLRSNAMTVNEISEKLGFYDTAYFCKCFKTHTGMTAKKYLETIQ